jgi:hypothetical protein
MPVTVKNPFIKERLKKAGKPPIAQALKIVKDDLVQDTRSRGWKRFGAGIQAVKDSDTKGRVFVNDNTVGGTATNKQIASWLHFGRGEVRPVKAQALRWLSKGKAVFSKYSKPTKPTYWWGLKDSIKEKVRKLKNLFYGK